MRVRTFVGRTVLVTAIVAAPGLAAGTALAAGSHAPQGLRASECATVTVKATPKLNTAMIPETIKSTVTSCATVTETVILRQHIAGPTKEAKVTITLSPGQAVTKTRSFPYSCCGGYTVTDYVHTTSGQQLAKAQASWTFA
ncbi:MAG TPA: hypothetical protein VGS19_10350 [Streptosporangiaceae bacterium]|nr:hypothetical protein [Streptosporangiaceae bacterium]